MIASYWVATNFILEAGDFMWFVRDKRVQRMNALENTPENFDKILKLLRSYTLDSKVEVGQVLNTASVESPVPGVELQLKHTIKTILKENQTIK